MYRIWKGKVSMFLKIEIAAFRHLRLPGWSLTVQALWPIWLEVINKNIPGSGITQLPNTIQWLVLLQLLMSPIYCLSKATFNYYP